MKLKYNDTVNDVRAVFDHDGHTYAVIIGADYDNCGPRERRELHIWDVTFMEAEYGAVLVPD